MYRTVSRLSSAQRALRRRQVHQVVRRPAHDRAKIAHLAARSFMPVEGSLSFDSPLVPFGQVILVVLSRHHITRRDGTAIERAYLRGYTATLNADSGIATWRTPRFAYDLNLPTRPGARRIVIPPTHRRLLHLALDLDQAIVRHSARDYPVCGGPILPATLLAFPQGTVLEPQQTEIVRTRAVNDGIPWPDAWHMLREEISVPDEAHDGDEVLIDTRLYPSSRATVDRAGALRAYHYVGGVPGSSLKVVDPTSCCEGDHFRHFRGVRGRGFRGRGFRGFRGGRGVWNAVRGLSASQRGASDVLSVLRARLGDLIADGCTDDDLRAALATPGRPLIASRLADIQVWRPPHDGSCAASFIGSDHGQCYDLWHTRAEWQGALGVGTQGAMAAQVGGELVGAA